MEDKTISVNPQSQCSPPSTDLCRQIPPLMEWKIKAHAHWIFPTDVALGSLTAIVSLIYAWIIVFMEDSSNRDFFKVTATSPLLLASFLWWGARKKTVWNYIITSEGGHVEYWEDYFENTKYVFRGLAVFAVVCILTMIAIAPELIWMIAGVGGMVILAAAKLASWENKVETQHFNWDRAQLIFIDRKRRLVVLERIFDPEVPFWQNYMSVEVFLSKERFDEFLVLCKKYAPADVKYEEGDYR